MSQSEINKRIDLEHEVIKYLLETARAAGFIPTSVWDGGETVKTASDAEVEDAVFSVDESVINFTHPTTGKYVACIVLGNDGYDCIADCSEGPGWDEVIKAVEERFDPEDVPSADTPLTKLELATQQLRIIRTNLNLGMSKSIQKLMARSIDEVLRELK